MPLLLRFFCHLNKALINKKAAWWRPFSILAIRTQKFMLLNIAMILLIIFIMNSCIALDIFCDLHHKNKSTLHF
ncbi:hypothetical protein HMPREF0880_01385 [Yokenella regensburgei ATCC 43003]|nr:hypothetical protein HMPREF0880_01385 [Yokenella regensburgei ATCC 43003]